MTSYCPLIISYQFSQPFPVLNNVLYLSGNDYTIGNGQYKNGLYKYDASNNDGLVLVKETAPTFDYNVIIPGETRITGNTLYMKVISETGGLDDANSGKQTVTLQAPK